MNGALLQARNLTRSSRSGDEQLRDISLYVHPGEIIALAGLGEGCANRLLDILAGRCQPAEGKVLIAGEDLYKNRRAFSTKIGYVPREDIVHRVLTVHEVLKYASRLRLPKEESRAARRRRVDEVLVETNLDQLVSRRVKDLNAEQRKRVNLSVELITNPELIFLQEPACDLSLNDEVKLMRTLRKLADQGRAIILSTQSGTGMMMADRLSLTLAGGRQAWFGPPAETLAFFNTDPSHPDASSQSNEWGELFETLGNVSEAEAQEWADLYRAHPAFKKYLPFSDESKKSGMPLDDRPLVSQREKSRSREASPTVPKFSSLRQFMALSARNLKTLARDRLGLVLVLAAPLLAASLDLVFTDLNMYDTFSGSSEKITLSSAVLIFLVMLFGGLSWVREIRKEAVIIQRERQAALKLIPYVLSKIWIVAIFALYQGLVWTAAHYLFVNIPGGLTTMLSFYITLASMALIGGILGLIASALARSVEGAALLVFIFLLPQLLFGGGLGQIQDQTLQQPVLTWANPASLGFAALVMAGGHLQAPFQDDCLGRSQEELRAMPEEQREACICLGADLFSKCSFPGIGRLEGQQTAGAKQPGDQIPTLGPPQMPLRTPGTSSDEYLSEVYSYTVDLNVYYLSHPNQSFEDKTRSQTTREIAIQNAERLIKEEYDRFKSMKNLNIPGLWAVLWSWAAVFTLVFAVIMKGKDANG